MQLLAVPTSSVVPGSTHFPRASFPPAAAARSPLGYGQVLEPHSPLQSSASHPNALAKTPSRGLQAQSHRSVSPNLASFPRAFPEGSLAPVPAFHPFSPSPLRLSFRLVCGGGRRGDRWQRGRPRGVSPNMPQIPFRITLLTS